MGHQFSKIMFTEAIKRLQQENGSLASYERMAERGESMDALGPDEKLFIRQRDSFYMASQGENGWPYMQHRGGSTGFLKVIDPRTLAFADFSGNKQYVSAGNLSVNDRVTLFLMDYPHRLRLKVLGHAEIVELGTDPELEAAVTLDDYKARVDRIIKVRVAAFDWNCSQHITPRYTEAELLERMEWQKASE